MTIAEYLKTSKEWFIWYFENRDYSGIDKNGEFCCYFIFHAKAGLVCKFLVVNNTPFVVFWYYHSSQVSTSKVPLGNQLESLVFICLLSSWFGYFLLYLPFCKLFSYFLPSIRHWLIHTSKLSPIWRENHQQHLSQNSNLISREGSWRKMMSESWFTGR